MRSQLCYTFVFVTYLDGIMGHMVYSGLSTGQDESAQPVPTRDAKKTTEPDLTRPVRFHTPPDPTPLPFHDISRTDWHDRRIGL